MNRVAIIGAGCAGLSAAIYLARANYEPLVFAGDLENKGGLLTKTFMVENYPGYPDGILGFDLIQNMEKQAVKFGAKIIEENVIRIEKSYHGFIISTDTQNYNVFSIIIASGSTPNKLGIPGEKELWGNGISSCAVCDGALYKDKKIVVVGGGDTACEHALFLTKFSNVTLIHRREELRASKIMQDRVLSDSKINIIYNTEIKSFVTENNKLVGLKLLSDKESEIPVDGLFYGLGLKPNNSLFNNPEATIRIEIDNDGYIVKKEHSSTFIPGIFVAGDICDKRYRQAVVAAGDGCMAALDCIEYLSISKN